jgi:multidrug transporter EmrE-like cation transporter
MIYWAYLLIAAFFESGWIYSLKFLNMKSVLSVRLTPLIQNPGNGKVLLPLAGYIGFGLCNIYFFSMAMKGIQASTAFAVWMALALIFSTALDILVFKQDYNMQQLFFTCVVLVGIIGLKYSVKS